MGKFYNVKNVNVDRIKEVAKLRGITMKYLCDCIGKRSAFLSQVRLGYDHIDTNELSIIADKLNTTVEYLTGQTDQAQRPPEAGKGEPAGDGEAAEICALIAELSPEQRAVVLDMLRGLAGKA